MKKIPSLIALALAVLICWAQPPHPASVELRLNYLCTQNPDKPCEEILSHCREAVEKKKECYIIS